MLLPLLVTASLAQGPGGLSLAVNDPSSHGTVGDSLLSLDEAIRVANGTLALSSLSSAEQAQVTGSGGVVETIAVDPAVVPTITLQSQLTDLVGNGASGPRLMVRGMAGGVRTVIQAGSQAQAFALRSPTVDVMGFEIQGGAVAIDAKLPNTPGPMVMARIMDCLLDGQTQAGVRLRATGGDETTVMTMRTELRNMPVGFAVDDQSAGGMVMGECEFLSMDGVGIGADVFEGGGGNLSMFLLFRSTFANGQTLVRKRRAPGSTQQFMFRLVFLDAQCTGDVVDVEGASGGLTMIHHHHSDFVAGAGSYAFRVYPRTALFDVHGSEMHFWGDVEVAGNPFTMRVWQQNNDYHAGTVRYDVDGALPNLLWNRYWNCTLEVPATALSPVKVRQSELYNTTVDGQSPFASITLEGCLLSGVTTNGSVIQTNNAPSTFLGDTTIGPVDPQIGTTFDLSADLPFGVGLVWIIAPSYARPTTTVEPVRFYGDPSTAIVLPGMVLFQSTTTVPLPSNGSLVGLEFYAQGVTVPLLGQSWMPAYHLPRGERIRPRP